MTQTFQTFFKRIQSNWLTSDSNDPSFILNKPVLDATNLTAGTGINISGIFPDFTISALNTQAIWNANSLQGFPISNTTPTNGQVLSYNGTNWIPSTFPNQFNPIAGTGITLTGTYPNITITNNSPDQIVNITGTGSTVVSGTYPNFTVNTPIGTTVNNGQLTINSSGIATGSGTFTANQATNSTISINVPGTNLTSSISGNLVTVNSSTGTGTSFTLPTASDDIRNQFASAQNANFWISGNGRLQNLYVTGGLIDLIPNSSNTASRNWKLLTNYNGFGQLDILRSSTNTDYASLSTSVSLKSTGEIQIPNLSGTGVRMVIADPVGVLSTQNFTNGTVTNLSVTNNYPNFITTSVSNSNTTPNITIDPVNAAPYTVYGNPSGTIGTPSFYTAGALTKTDDANVTLTITGNPSVALLKNVSLGLGWSGVLSVARGGTGLSSVGTNGQVLISNGTNWTLSNPPWTSNTGTVTQVQSGGGMSFSTITGAGPVNMGTPSNVTLSSSNLVSGTTHSHAFSPGGNTSQYITGAGTLATFPTIPSTPSWENTLTVNNIATSIPIISRGTDTTSIDYMLFRPSDFGLNKPYLGISKSSISGRWGMYTYDGNNFSGEIYFNTSNIVYPHLSGSGTRMATILSDGAISTAPLPVNPNLIGGSGISVTGTYPNLTITNTAPNQIISLTGSGATTVTGTYPNFNISSVNTTYSAGTGLSLVGTTFNNTAPDQIVSITGSGAAVVTGTYPNFNINVPSVTDTNFAISNLVFSGNRTHNANTFDLTISNASRITLGASEEVIINSSLYVDEDVTLNNLSGTGNRMVIAGNLGNLSTQAIPVDTNFATTNLTLTGNRLHDFAGHVMDFINANYFAVQATSNIDLNVDGTNSHDFQISDATGYKFGGNNPNPMLQMLSTSTSDTMTHNVDKTIISKLPPPPTGSYRILVRENSTNELRTIDSEITASIPTLTFAPGWSGSLAAGSNDNFGIIVATSPALSGTVTGKICDVALGTPKTTILVPTLTLEDESVYVNISRSVTLGKVSADKATFSVFIAKQTTAGDTYRIMYHTKGY